MAEMKSVTFSPILEQAYDEVSVGSSETELFSDGIKSEDAYIASLSKSARKYQIPTEDERRVPRRRKIVLTLGFILLLGIGGVVIYLVTRELYSREQHYQSGAVSENKTGFAPGNTSVKESTISVDSFNTIKPSSKSSKKQLSWHSVHETDSHSQSEEATSVVRTLTPTTVIQSSALVTHFKTKKRNATKSTFSTPNLASPKKTTSHWLSRQDPTQLYSTSELTRDTSEPGERKIATSYLGYRTSSWNDADDDVVNERKTFTESGFVAHVSSLNITRSTRLLAKSRAKSSLFQKASSNASSLSLKKSSTTGTFSTTPQDIRTLVSGVSSSGCSTVSSSFSTAVRASSEFEYSKSVGESIDSQTTTKRSERLKLGQTSLSAVTTAILQSPWVSSKTVYLTIRGTTSTLSPTTKSSLPSSSSHKQSHSTSVITSLGRSLPGKPFSHGCVSSQSISPATLDGQYSTMVKETSSASDHNKRIWSMSASPTPAVTFTFELVSSSIKVHETSQSALLSKLFSTESKLVSSRSLNDDNFSTVVITSFPSLALFTKQGSGTVLTPTKATSLVVTQRSNPSTLGPRSTNRVFWQTVKHTLVISTLPWYTRKNGVSTARDVTSLKTSTLLASRLQTSPLISQTQSRIEATSFDSAVMFNSPSGTKSSSLVSSSRELNSLPVTMVWSYGSISSHANYDYLTFASEATINGFLSWIATQNIASQSPSSNSKPVLTSRRMTTQRWHAERSTDSVQQLNPKSSVKEKLPTNLTIKTTNLAHSYQQTLHKCTIDALALSTVTSSLIATALSSTQSTAMSQAILSIDRSLSPDQLTPNRMSSHPENTRLSTVTSSMKYLTSNNPLETSGFQTWYKTTSDTLEISIITRFSITKAMSNSRGISTAEPVSMTTISQLHDGGFSTKISSTRRSNSSERRTVSLSSKRAHSVSTMELNKTFRHTLVNSSKDTPTNSTATRRSIATISPPIQSTIFSLNESSASRINTALASRNTSLYTYNTTHSQYALPGMETVRIFPSPPHTSTSQVKPLDTTHSYSFSTVLINYGPTSNSTAQFKIMDGSFVIRNKKFHANLSNPKTTMFKALADEVEEIIMDIISLDAEVTSFKNGSIIANFYLLVPFGSPFSDRDYAQMLSEANETLWRGYQVANITVILRVNTRRTAAHLQDGGGLSKAAVAAIFTVFSVLLVAVGCFGVYSCKKKGLCERSRVKPADSPIPASELEKIQPVRRGTWVMNDEPFLKVDVPKDPNHRSASFYETLNMRFMEKDDTEPDDPDLLRKSTRSPFEPEYAKKEAKSDSIIKNAHPSASGSVSSAMKEIDYVDRPISGSSRNTYLNIHVASTSTHSEDQC